MELIAEWMKRAIDGREDEKISQNLREEVIALTNIYSLSY